MSRSDGYHYGTTLTLRSMDVVVQPAVNWVNLNEQIKDTGLFLPLDPSPTVCHSEGIILLDA